MPPSRRQFPKQASRKAPPAVKNYVKRAIESKRDTITDCNFNEDLTVGYDGPFIVNMTPSPTKSQGQDVDFHNLNMNIALNKATTSFIRIIVLQWFQDSANGAPTLADVLCSASATADSVYEGFDQAHIHQKFAVIKDKLIVNTPNKNNGVSVMKMRIAKKSLQRKVLRSTGGGQYKNNLYLLIFNDTLVSVPMTVKVGSEYSFKNRD